MTIVTTKERKRQRNGKTPIKKKSTNLKILLSALTEILKCCLKMEENVQKLRVKIHGSPTVQFTFHACNLLFLCEFHSVALFNFQKHIATFYLTPGCPTSNDNSKHEETGLSKLRYLYKLYSRFLNNSNGFIIFSRPGVEGSFKGNICFLNKFVILIGREEQSD